MDIDEVEVEIEVTPAPDEQAHLVLAAQFNPFPFTHDARNAIFARRSLMSDELVFDLLLEQASIASPQSLFPPDSPDTLLDLLDAIARCPWDALKKSCLFFYLLSYVSSNVAAEYAETWALPAQFVNLAHACFLLDSGTPDDLARAVALLSDARIVQDLSSKILHTLSLAPEPASSRLVRAYVRSVSPVLEAYEDLAIYLTALLEYSLADAWTFQRSFSETTPIRNQLFRTVLDRCLIPPKPSVLPHLLSLPLTTFEFSLLQSYALSPPETLTPAAHAILQDLITVRLLHSGRYSDAIRLSRAFDAFNAKSYASTAAGTTDATGVAALHNAAHDRQQMMRDVLAVIPEVQSRQLELELNEEQADGEGSGSGALGTSWASMSMSLGSDVSMSWENLGASGASAKARSGRLEGSPAPKPPARHAPPNTPFGLVASPTNARMRGEAPINLFGTPTTVATGVRSIPSALPTIPTPGLNASVAGSAGTTTTPLTMPSTGFRPPPRYGVGISPVRQVQPPTAINGVMYASVTSRVGRNVFGESERPRAGAGTSSLFGRSMSGENSSNVDVFSTSKMRRASGSGGMNVSNDTSTRSPSQSARPTTTTTTTTAAGVNGDTHEQMPTEEDDQDVTMLDSDDPDGFVVRGRRRRSFRPLAAPALAPQTRANDSNPTVDSATNASANMSVDLSGATSVGATAIVHTNGATTLFGGYRPEAAGGAPAVTKPKSTLGGLGTGPGRRTASPQVQTHAKEETRVLPGGLLSFDSNESASESARPAPSVAPAPAPTTQASSSSRLSPPHAQPSRPPSLRPNGKGSKSQSQSDMQTLRIPGGLFDDGDADAEANTGAEAGEEQDNVPSLPTLSSSKATTAAAAATPGRRTRLSRASSATESGDDEEDDNVPKRTLRRSSRLSSSGLSPEPASPQKIHERRTSKRSGRTGAAAALDGTGRSTRKRKNADG